jgi:DNA-binding transcriptional ArsR family regulator
MTAFGEAELSRVAALMGQPARAAMLDALMGGQWLTASELARRARVAPPTASGHLGLLVDAGLVVRRSTGRRRYHALASADVAAALEALGRIGAPAHVQPSNGSSAIRFARTCYDHLAGSLGVRVTDALLAHDLVSRDGHDITERGVQRLAGLGIDVAALRGGRRPLVRLCLDGSERRHHLAGAVGAALTTTMLERGWLARLEGTRAVRFTLRGREGLYRLLELDVEVPGIAKTTPAAVVGSNGGPRPWSKQ